LKPNSRGNVLIIAIAILLVLSIMIPAMIKYIQNESKWTMKEQQTTRAFQLAEGGVERGFQQVILSTTVWGQIQAGTVPTGLHFDQLYTDIAGGTYALNISSGPGTQQVTITGVGRDASTKEVRAVSANYGNTASNAAIFAMGGLTLTGNPVVEWGPVLSPATITTDKAHPRFYSAGDVTLDPNGPTPPNSDNVQWWSYDAALPPPPQVDLQAYLSSATAQGHVYAGGTYVLGNVSGAYYFSGDTTLKSNSFINGDIVVLGNLTVQGSAGSGAYPATLPTNAWREYGNDWANYRATYDGGAPGTFPGVSGTYTHGSITYPLTNVVVHGFLYVLNSFSITGGGNCTIHGSMYLGSQSDLSGSHVTIYYDDTLTVKTKNLSLARQSWREISCDWSGTYPVCP
jgi:hypothetical protein